MKKTADSIPVNQKAVEMARFGKYLRLKQSLRVSDTEMVYAISEFLNINFDEASKAVNVALGIC